MRRFFDSSVLVPVFYAHRPHHAASAALFIAARNEDSFCALHTSAEIYATLTGVPVRPRISNRDGTGGAAYDALIAQCALKAGADVLLTWNLRDFIRFDKAIASLAKTPLQIQFDE